MSRRIIITVLIIVAVGLVLTNIDFSRKSVYPDQVKVKLYFATQDAMYLEAETREVKSDELYLNTIKELDKGPKTSSLSPTIPHGVQINEIRVKQGTAYLDFSRELKDNHWGGSTGERLTVYSIVNTMCQFPEIDRVQLLLAGQKIDTLVGHMYLAEPLEPEDDLVKK